MHAVQPWEVLRRLPNIRFYIKTHVQRLAGLDSDSEKRVTVWTFGMESALERSDALLPSLTVVAGTPTGGGLGAAERPVRKGVTTSGRCCFGRHRKWSDRGKQR